MDTDRKASEPKIEAKLFWNGRSQAVRLPKEFRFEGNSVNIRRVEGGVLLEAKPQHGRTPEAIAGWFAKLDALTAGEPFPERAPQELAPIREWFE